MKYEDFIIKIEGKLGDDYGISIESPAGEGDSVLQLPFELDAVADILIQLGDTFRSGAAPGEGADTTREMAFAGSDMAPTTSLAKDLFDGLFTGTARSLFDQSLGMTRGEDRGLRIKLQIDAHNPDIAALASLPWELLYREETRDYLSLSRQTPLVRYLNVQRPFAPQAFQPPLRILVVMSSPEGVAPLNLEAERELIENSWARQEGVEVDFLERPATKQRLSDKLAEKPYHVLHYMGHGDFDKATGQGVLLLEDEDHQPVPLDGQTLGGVMLHDVKSLRLVFLNACDTAKATKKKGQDPFAGVATAMIMGGIPAVVAMQFPITDKAAVRFAGCFYPRIVQGYPVDAAVAEGRKAIRLGDAASMEWATPVLFMRSPDGVLFDVAVPTEPPGGTDIPQPGAAAPPAPQRIPVEDGAAPASGSAPKGKVMIIGGAIAAVVALAIASYFLLDSGVSVPDVADYTIELAEKRLEESELSWQVAGDEPSAKPKGTVIRSDPAPGEKIRKGATIKLFVADGTMQVPDLKGESEADARSTLNALPLTFEKIVQEISDAGDGVVLRAEPGAGQIISHDAKVTLVVAASGVEIPDVAAQDPVKAMEILNGVGLRSELKYELNMDGNPGKVIRTDPPAGTAHIPEVPVVMYVSARGGWIYLGKQINDTSLRLRRAGNLRDLDDDSGKKIGVANAGETVTIIESRRNGWTKVQAGSP